MIRAFVGRNGYGKTLGMVAQMAIPSWRAGRPTVANFGLHPEKLGYPEVVLGVDGPVPLAIRLRSYLDIPRLGRHMDEHGEPRRLTDAEAAALGEEPGALWSITGNLPCTLLLDEITSVLPARDAVNVPPELQRMLNQFRKPDVWVGWSAPAWARADLMLREVTMDVVESRPVLEWLTSKTVKGQSWKQHRCFRWTVYDAFEYEEADAGRVSWNAVGSKRSFLLSPRRRKLIQSVYNTLEGVELLDHIQCGVCGGRIPRKVCRGHDERRPKAVASDAAA